MFRSSPFAHIIFITTTAATLLPLCAYAEQICPKYPYMFHGTYVSYYAITRNAVTPFCGQPVSFDGPDNLSGNCETGAGCSTVLNVLTRGGRPHHTHSNLITNGISAPNNQLLKAGADLIRTGVNIVEFRKNTGPGGVKLKARVFLVGLDPTRFEPPTTGDKVTTGIGYQVLTGTPDRTVDNDEVVTRSRNRHQATILVQIRDNEWRQYNIILISGQGTK